MAIGNRRMEVTLYGNNMGGDPSCVLRSKTHCLAPCVCVCVLKTRTIVLNRGSSFCCRWHLSIFRNGVSKSSSLSSKIFFFFFWRRCRRSPFFFFFLYAEGSWHSVSSISAQRSDGIARTNEFQLWSHRCAIVSCIHPLTAPPLLTP